MSTIRVSNTLDDLAADTRTIATTTPARLVKVVRGAAIEGNKLARGFAKESSGRHGRLYPGTFSWELRKYFGFGGGAIEAEYGPDASRPQGAMSFEEGSRNQPPHHDLAKSADMAGPSLVHDLHDVLDDLFWPT